MVAESVLSGGVCRPEYIKVFSMKIRLEQHCFPRFPNDEVDIFYETSSGVSRTNSVSKPVLETDLRAGTFEATSSNEDTQRYISSVSCGLCE